MALQSISGVSGGVAGDSSIARSSRPTNNPAQRASELRENNFSNVVKGDEAFLQGITAASVNSNKNGRQLFEELYRSQNPDQPTITNLLRRTNPINDEDVARFNLNTNYRQLFRLYVEDIQGTTERPETQALRSA